MVAEHGGGIFVDTEPGRGTKFSFWLPSSDSSLSGVVDSSADGDLGRGTERILVVDDSEAILKVVARVLGERGYDVQVESRPTLALERMRNETVDLMLIDILMPEMNGVQLVKKIHPLNPNAKVLMMTGYSSAGILDQIAEEGLPVMWKPFTPTALIERVRQVLDDNLELTSE
jgi:DNA-binding NtrC family response regulator